MRIPSDSASSSSPEGAVALTKDKGGRGGEVDSSDSEASSWAEEVSSSARVSSEEVSMGINK